MYGLARPERATVERLGQFVTVGALATGLQTGLLWLFTDVGGLYYLLAAVIAIEITILSQYVVNNAWTFAERSNDGADFLSGMLRTNLVRGSAIPIQTGLLWLFVTYGGLGVLLANLCAILPSGVYRYVLDARWTWRTTPPEDG
ncbi:GtrA family protein [Halosegnis marinus]|uniref:GtrA family protein n=1 Tax=Halosegnis marinus TaxID=3034023 RepID=A0ABD5ZPV0_9EURY|nr:GtrA family protein [Halosegnis sp. DT85]